MIFKTKKQIFQTKFGLKGLILLHEKSNNVENNLVFHLYCALISLQPWVTFEDIQEIIDNNDLTMFSVPSEAPSLLELEELYSMAVGEIGVSPTECMTMTPQEIKRAYNNYLRKKETEANLVKIAIASSDNDQLIRLTKDLGYTIGNLEERNQTFENLKIGGLTE